MKALAEAQVARVLRRCLAERRVVEIDGLGTFRPQPGGGFQFASETRPKAFLAYVEEDLDRVSRIHDVLIERGVDAWLDRKKLLPGQNWPRAIERAIETCDFFIACLSRRSLLKRGSFQSELRYALDCAARVPLDDIYFIPVRLEDCPLPLAIRQRIQYVDLFPRWETGIESIFTAITRQRRTQGVADGGIWLPLAG